MAALTRLSAGPIIAGAFSWAAPSLWCRMLLEDVFLAKFAEFGPDGLFTVVGGGVNRINVSEFPSSWGFLYLLARVRLTTEEAQAQHVTNVERESPNGNVEPVTAESPMEPLSPTAEMGPDGRAGLTFIIFLVNLLFPEPGVYKYRFKIDGREMGVAELLVAGPAESERVQ